jgi:Terminase large subunit, T4likevirus-type, N-terminal
VSCPLSAVSRWDDRPSSSATLLALISAQAWANELDSLLQQAQVLGTPMAAVQRAIQDLAPADLSKKDVDSLLQQARVRATLFNATEPDQLRGPQHSLAWCDELAKWQYAEETWDQLQFGLRLGKHPRQIVATTPRPIPVLRRILADPSTVTLGQSRRFSDVCDMSG